MIGRLGKFVIGPGIRYGSEDRIANKPVLCAARDGQISGANEQLISIILIDDVAATSESTGRDIIFVVIGVSGTSHDRPCPRLSREQIAGVGEQKADAVGRTDRGR